MFVDAVGALGARVDVVALSRATVALPADLAERAAAHLAVPTPVPDPSPGGRDPGGRDPGDAVVRLADHGWPAGLPVGGRHGFRAADHARLDTALPALARSVGARPGETTLVLGTEELMALPLRLAQTLADAGCTVRFSTTTRSPAVVLDEPGYALRSGSGVTG